MDDGLAQESSDAHQIKKWENGLVQINHMVQSSRKLVNILSMLQASRVYIFAE